jgi:triacylglycerol lipase
VIVTTNPGDVPGFFPWFDGKTWEITGDGKYRTTLSGDGVVAHRESVLPGISLDVLSASREESRAFAISGPVLSYPPP